MKAAAIIRACATRVSGQIINSFPGFTPEQEPVPRAGRDASTENERAVGQISGSVDGRDARSQITIQTRRKIQRKQLICTSPRQGNGAFDLPVTEHIVPARGVHWQQPNGRVRKQLRIEIAVSLESLRGNIWVLGPSRLIEPVGSGAVIPRLVICPAQIEHYFCIVWIP